MLVGENEEDFEIARNLLESNQIKLTRWRLIQLESKCDYFFSYNYGRLYRRLYRSHFGRSYSAGNGITYYKFKMTYDIGEQEIGKAVQGIREHQFFGHTIVS